VHDGRFEQRRFWATEMSMKIALFRMLGFRRFVLGWVALFVLRRILKQRAQAQRTGSVA